MKSFLLSFLLIFFFEMDTGYAEKFSPKKLHLNKILSNEYLPVQEISCATDEECQSFILNSKCHNNFCKCTSDNILSSDGSKCLPHAKEYGSPCDDNIQCSHLLSTGGVCDNSTCICKTGYHYLKGFCWKSVDLHKKCYRNEQCFSAYEYVGLECKNNLCKCRENFYERLNSGCRRKRKTGESCNLDMDCTDQSICESMQCSPSTKLKITDDNFTSFTNERLGKSLSCPRGMYELNNKCVRELGMNCTTDSDCKHITNALCLDGIICACRPVLNVASEDNRQCLRVSRGKVEDIQRASCKSNPECGVFGGNSFCQNKKCTCKNGTYFEKDSSFCWTIKSLNEACEDSRDCQPSISHSHCVETKLGKLCSCQKGYHPNGMECLRDAWEVGDFCKSDEDCFFPNSFCNNSNVCSCKEHYYLENGKCIPGIRTSCSKDSDCAHLINTECKIQNSSVKRCLCLENYTHSENYKYCLPIVNYNEKCKESFQCKFPMGDQGECKENICDCPEKEHYFKGKCYRSKFIGERCSSLSECFSGNDTNSVICLRGFCFCNYDYELENGKICVKANSAIKTNFYFKSWTFLVFLLILRK